MRSHLLVIWLIATALTAAAHDGQPGAPSVRTEAVVSADWLAAHLRDPSISVVHVGADRKSYDEGHIPGARFLALRDIAVPHGTTPNELPPIADLVARFDQLGLGDTGRIVLYGDSQGLLAARMFFTLDYLGHGHRAAVLDGGLERWRKDGRPVVVEESHIAPRRFTPRVNPDVIVAQPVVADLSWLASRGGNAEWMLIDARPEAQFRGDEAGEGIERAGHIPGATSLFWQRTIVSVDNPVLRPDAELRQLFASLGVTPARSVVTYCRTGVQASFAYFVARYLGYRVKMYDGGFMEWSHTPGSTVATGQ